MKLSLQNLRVRGCAPLCKALRKACWICTVGSVLRAQFWTVYASIALWLQWLIVQVLATTRLATSLGADCDSFGADF